MAAALLPSMMNGLGRNLLFVAVLVVVAWALLEALGFEMALVSSLGLSIVLTLALNLVLARRSAR